MDPNIPYENVVNEILTNYSDEVALSHRTNLLQIMKSTYDSKVGAEAHTALPAGVFEAMLDSINSALADDWKGMKPGLST